MLNQTLDLSLVKYGNVQEQVINVLDELRRHVVCTGYQRVDVSQDGVRVFLQLHSEAFTFLDTMSDRDKCIENSKFQ